jgi:hypothetical protein
MASATVDIKSFLFDKKNEVESLTIYANDPKDGKWGQQKNLGTISGLMKDTLPTLLQRLFKNGIPAGYTFITKNGILPDYKKTPAICRIRFEFLVDIVVAISGMNKFLVNWMDNEVPTIITVVQIRKDEQDSRKASIKIWVAEEIAPTDLLPWLQKVPEFKEVKNLKAEFNKQEKSAPRHVPNNKISEGHRRNTSAPTQRTQFCAQITTNRASPLDQGWRNQFALLPHPDDAEEDDTKKDPLDKKPLNKERPRLFKDNGEVSPLNEFQSSVNKLTYPKSKMDRKTKEMYEKISGKIIDLIPSKNEDKEKVKINAMVAILINKIVVYTGAGGHAKHNEQSLNCWGKLLEILKSKRRYIFNEIMLQLQKEFELEDQDMSHEEIKRLMSVSSPFSTPREVTPISTPKEGTTPISSGRNSPSLFTLDDDSKTSIMKRRKNVIELIMHVHNMGLLSQEVIDGCIRHLCQKLPNGDSIERLFTLIHIVAKSNCEKCKESCKKICDSNQHISPKNDDDEYEEPTTEETNIDDPESEPSPQVYIPESPVMSPTMPSPKLNLIRKTISDFSKRN